MTMTRIIKLTLLLLALMSSITTTAHNFEVDGIYYGIITNNTNDKRVYVTFIGSDYIYNLNRYTGNVTIPSTVTYNGIEYSVTSIGSYAFYGCTGLNSVNIPNSVTSIERSAFYGCSRLTSVNIPNSVTNISECTFYGCSGLTSVNIPNSVTSIGSYAFYGCSGLTSVNIPNSVTNISGYAFYGCSGLTSVNIPNSVTNISEYAFYGCSGLTSVNIPNSITNISNYTFQNCRKLKTVIIPYPVTRIGYNAFDYCENLTDVTCLAITPPGMDNYRSLYPGYYMATLHVPANSVEAYKASDWWSCFIDIVGDASEEGNGNTQNGPQTDKCDANGDGVVNISDINTVIDAILKN